MLDYNARTFRELADDLQQRVKAIDTWNTLSAIAWGIIAGVFTDAAAGVVGVKPDTATTAGVIIGIAVIITARRRDGMKLLEMRIRVGEILCLAAIEENTRVHSSGVDEQRRVR